MFCLNTSTCGTKYAFPKQPRKTADNNKHGLIKHINRTEYKINGRHLNTYAYKKAYCGKCFKNLVMIKGLETLLKSTVIKHIYKYLCISKYKFSEQSTW